MYVSEHLLFVACNGGSFTDWYGGEEVAIPGQVQLWNTSTMTLIDTLQFSLISKPWHIINSPIQNHVYVTLAGTSGQGSGVVCLNYDNNDLNIIWETYSQEFHTLHGIDISDDGKTIFISGRRDDNLHIIRSEDGKKIKSIPLSENALAAGIKVVYY